MREHGTHWLSISGIPLASQLLPLLPALAGSVVALQFLGRDLPLRHKLSSVLVGTLCALYLAPAVIVWLNIEGKALHESLQFLIGLFAVAVGREIFREIEGGLIARVRDKLLGGAKE